MEYEWNMNIMEHKTNECLALWLKIYNLRKCIFILVNEMIFCSF